ncbi:hypothetical protein [Phormidesmis sp. 146-33]
MAILEAFSSGERSVVEGALESGAIGSMIGAASIVSSEEGTGLSVFAESDKGFVNSVMLHPDNIKSIDNKNGNNHLKALTCPSMTLIL